MLCRSGCGHCDIASDGRCRVSDLGLPVDTVMGLAYSPSTQGSVRLVSMLNERQSWRWRPVRQSGVELVNDSGVGGDLRTELRVLRSRLLVGFLRFSGLLFEIRVRRRVWAGSFYAASEFVGEVRVLMGQHPATGQSAVLRAVIAATSSAVSGTACAARFSFRCVMLLVPGMGRVAGECCNCQASAI